MINNVFFTILLTFMSVQTIFAQNVSDKFKINVSEFNRGIYLIKLIDKENKSVSKKLIID